MERRQKIKEELYLYLLNKREENELTQRMTESNARIIDPAAGSNAPVAPKSMMILLASIVLGCAIPAGVLWLLAVSDTKVRSRKDVEGVLSVPFLGEIPMRDKKDKSEVVVHENGRDSVSEAFRIVRTNMDFMRVKDKKMQVVMFTSFNPGAGKTFVSMNPGDEFRPYAQEGRFGRPRYPQGDAQFACPCIGQGCHQLSVRPYRQCR